MAYASGKYAYGMCDRCGFQYFLSELRKEWNGLKTCPECFETKQPQLGDLIVCVERRNKISITGGFYTTREKMGEYSKSCDFVKKL